MRLIYDMTTKTINQINPNKLHLSKWTAIAPINKEKHFIVTKVIKDDLEQVSSCIIEAVITHRESEINWLDLQDSNKWLYGWQ